MRNAEKFQKFMHTVAIIFPSWMTRKIKQTIDQITEHEKAKLWEQLIEASDKRIFVLRLFTELNLSDPVDFINSAQQEGMELMRNEFLNKVLSRYK